MHGLLCIKTKHFYNDKIFMNIVINDVSLTILRLTGMYFYTMYEKNSYFCVFFFTLKFKFFKF